MLDPAVVLAGSLFFGAFWMVAGAHKLATRPAFAAVLAEYRLLPDAAVGVASLALPLFELTLGGLWLLGPAMPVTAVATGSLLVLYGLAIAINLVRGRAHISCGCGFGGDTPLSAGLVGRNLVVASFALALALPAGMRAVTWLDHVAAVACALALLLLYAAGSQLFDNGGALASWRRHD